MPTISRALLVALISFSTVAQGESRFPGIFFTNGLPLQIETDNKVPPAKVIMPAGHLPLPELKLPSSTRKRFDSDQIYLPFIMQKANARFAEKLAELKKDAKLIRLAKQIAPKYNVDPVVVVAAVLTELTFNNDYSMKLQNMAAYIPSQSFYPGANELIEKVKLPQMKMCQPERMDYWSWTCVANVWDANLRISQGLKAIVPANAYIPMSPKEEGFMAKVVPKLLTFPTGMSYGPGQITLFRAILVSDDIARVSGGKFQKLSLEDMPAVQRMVSELEPTVHVISATIGRSIYAYRKYARIDISANVGLQTTLYNIGSEIQRAVKSKYANLFAKEEKWQLPQENYFGYFANEHEQEIRALVNQVN